MSTKMVKVVRAHETGGAEKLVYEDLELGAPKAGEVCIKQNAIGLNFIDVYMRSGLYPLATMPAILGMEAAGVVEEVAQGVEGFQVGDRVVYCMVPGAYAEKRNISTQKLLKLPDGIDDQSAAAMMLKGLTAHYLLFRTYQVQPGDTILVMAAAGGVGLLLCQWAKFLGARVIGCVGSNDKANCIKAYGVDHTILYNTENIVERVKDITKGEGVAVSYDSVGKSTFEASLDSLRPCGTYVSYGNASGPVVPFSPSILASKGSLYVTRPTLATHIATRALLEEGAKRLFNIVESHGMKIPLNHSRPLAETVQAHIDLEARVTTGATILIP